MNPTAKLLIFAGLVLVLAGVVWQLTARWIPWGRLPGDVVIQRDSFRVYIPIVTCLVVSMLLSLVFWAWRFFQRGP